VETPAINEAEISKRSEYRQCLQPYGHENSNTELHTSIVE
jgi:hypothetical protein